MEASEAMIKTELLSAEELDLIRRDYEARIHGDLHRLLGHIAALESELARLTPTGQVAEDEKAVEDDLTMDPEAWGIVGRRARSALARLASKAQAHDAAVADNAPHLTGFAHVVVALLRQAKTLEADNAGLRRALGPLAMMCCEVERAQPGPTQMVANWPPPKCGTCDVCAARKALLAPNPGAALLDEVGRLRECQQIATDHATSCAVSRMAEQDAHRKALAHAANKGLRKMLIWADEQEARAKAQPLGDTVDGGPLHGASRYNVAMECVRAVRAAVEASLEPEE